MVLFTHLTVVLRVSNLAKCYKMMQKTWKMTGTLAHGYSSESTKQSWTFQLIPTWQGLNGFQKSLRPCALDKSSLSIRRVKEVSKSCVLVLWRKVASASEGLRKCQNLWRKVASALEGLRKYQYCIVVWKVANFYTFYELFNCCWVDVTDGEKCTLPWSQLQRYDKIIGTHIAWVLFRFCHCSLYWLNVAL